MLPLNDIEVSDHTLSGEEKFTDFYEFFFNVFRVKGDFAIPLHIGLLIVPMDCIKQLL